MPERIFILERVRQQRRGKILIANWPDKPMKRRRPDGSETHVGRGRIRSAVVHRRANLHARRKAVENEPSGLAFQNLQQFFRVVKIGRCAMNGCRELAFQVLRNLLQLRDGLRGNQN